MNQTDWTAIGAVSAAGALITATYQIREIRREAKRSRTLIACERYDIDPVLTACLRAVKKAKDAKALKRRAKSLSFEIHTIINYLDQLAIGSETDAYSEVIVRDYMFYIATSTYKDLIKSGIAKDLGWEPKHYQALTRMCKHWENEDAGTKGLD